MGEFRGTLAWLDENEGKSQHGEGISRAVSGAETQLYRLRVKQMGAMPMYVELKAESAEHAVRYGKARWPIAIVTLAPKP
jgi:hypothetical protein